VIDIQVTQRESGNGAGGENNVRWNRASIVGTALGAVRVDYRETIGRGIKKAVRGEEVQSHHVTPSEKAGEEGNRSQKETKNVKCNLWLTATGGGRGKDSKQIKRGVFAPVDRRVLEGDNGWRVGQLRERPEQRKKHIPAPEAVVLNECEGFQSRGRWLLTSPRGSVVLHWLARPELLLLIGEGL